MVLTERQRTILNAVTERYIGTGAPISSKELAGTIGLQVSSSTVRNEFALLEERGYLTHPHTSAGRVPTDLGYREFVEKYRYRRRVLFAGANDGLFHAFDIGAWDRTPTDCAKVGDGTTPPCYDLGTGLELFAFAPRAVMPVYPDLTAPAGAQTKQNEWTVDGSQANSSDYFVTRMGPSINMQYLEETQITVAAGDENNQQELFDGLITGLEADFPKKGPPELVVLAEDAFQRARASNSPRSAGSGCRARNSLSCTPATWPTISRARR